MPFVFSNVLKHLCSIGKVALVTGGGSGLGSMMAAALVQNGAKVYIASRKEKQLKEVCRLGIFALLFRASKSNDFE